MAVSLHLTRLFLTAQVGIVEAGTTFLMFPVLVIAAYLANQYKGKEEDGSEIARSPRLDQNYVTGIGSGADQKNFQPYMVAQYLKDMNLTDIAIGGQADDDENAAAIAMAIAQSGALGQLRRLLTIHVPAIVLFLTLHFCVLVVTACARGEAVELS